MTVKNKKMFDNLPQLKFILKHQNIYKQENAFHQHNNLIQTHILEEPIVKLPNEFLCSKRVKINEYITTDPIRILPILSDQYPLIKSHFLKSVKNNYDSNGPGASIINDNGDALINCFRIKKEDQIYRCTFEERIGHKFFTTQR